jgi:chemotaxis protein MotB
MAKIGIRLAAILTGLMVSPAMGLAVEPLTLSEEEMIVAQNPGAGFVRPGTPYEARVSAVTGDSQTTGNRRLLGAGQQIYLDLTNPQETAPGDLFTVYRRVKKIYHPIRGDYLGDLTAVVGVVKVLRVTDSKATVMIERSYGAIYPGDGASRHIASAPAPAPASHALPDGTGVIVDLPLGQTLIGQGHIVYVDWGRADGVRIGDRLQVFREHADIPTQIIGQLQIIAVEERTATARITKSTAPLVRGDRFAALQRQPGAEAPSPQDRKEALFREMTPAAAAAPKTAEAVQEAHAAPSSRDIERELAELARQLEFNPGEAPVTAATMPKLARIKELLKEVPDRRVVVKGHTDSQSIGPSLKQLYNSNQELSRARAAEVAGYVSKDNGINPQNVSVVGLSATKPVASNGTEAGRKKNRRIEIVLLPAEPAPAPKAATPEAVEPPSPAPEPAPAEPTPPVR